MENEDIEIIETGQSILGTKEYWDNIYERDKKNFAEFGDKGDSWFGEDSVIKMVDWVAENYTNPNVNIIDLGCGNGEVLFRLADEGFKTLTGIDYSEASITLSKNIATEENYEFVKFKTVDFLNNKEVEELGKYEVILDKGTYDAISLNPDNKTKGEDAPINIYPKSVQKLMTKNSIFLITSCNYTEEELKIKFKPYFKQVSRISYPKIKFGGYEGQTICSLAFKSLEYENEE